MATLVSAGRDHCDAHRLARIELAAAVFNDPHEAIETTISR